MNVLSLQLVLVDKFLSYQLFFTKLLEVRVFAPEIKVLALRLVTSNFEQDREVRDIVVGAKTLRYFVQQHKLLFCQILIVFKQCHERLHAVLLLHANKALTVPFVLNNVRTTGIIFQTFKVKFGEAGDERPLMFFHH